MLFAETCGLCSNKEAAYAMFASLNRLKDRLGPWTRIYPGHSYGLPPGQTMTRVLKDNMYLHFPDQESFAAYRLRRGLDVTSCFRFAEFK